MVLANHHSEQKDQLRQRAMFESALVVFTLPRHRQMMCGFLSRAATRGGDLDAAEEWLAPCDTRSDDLETDTAWRISRAWLDTARADWAAVHQALGATPTAVPVADLFEPLALLLRANAWERLGRLDTASDQLREAMQRGVTVRASLEAIVRVHPEWALCRQTFQRAEAAHSSQAASAAGGGLGAIGGIFFWVGLPILLVSLVCIVLTLLFGVGAVAAGAIPLVVKLRAAQRMQVEGLAGALGTAAFVCLMVLPGALPVGVIFTGIGHGFRKAAKRAKRLRLHGIRGTAQVTGLKPTGMSVNDVPQVELGLRVQLPGEDPYEAKTRMLLAPHLASLFAPGASVAVRVDPDDRQEVLLESD